MTDHDFVDKKALSEGDICTKFITTAIKEVARGVHDQADYILSYNLEISLSSNVNLSLCDGREEQLCPAEEEREQLVESVLSQVEMGSQYGE